MEARKMGDIPHRLESSDGPTWLRLLGTVPAFLFSAAMIVCLGLGLLAVLVSWKFNRPPFSLDLLERLDASMSVEQVQQVLGPPADWWLRDDEQGRLYLEWAYHRPGSWPIVYIYFTPEGRFSSSEYDY